MNLKPGRLWPGFYFLAMLLYGNVVTKLYFFSKPFSIPYI